MSINGRKTEDSTLKPTVEGGQKLRKTPNRENGPTSSEMAQVYQSASDQTLAPALSHGR